MSPPICHNCLRTARTASRQAQHYRTRHQPYFSKASPQPSTTPSTTTQIDLAALLSTPTWSIRSLLSSPPANQQSDPLISPAQLSHLLRLSALPSPSTPSETKNILSTLQSQLLFVREIQKVDTTGVQPLSSIRDESTQGLKESTITLDTLQPELANEESFGHCKRPRRRRDAPSASAENTSYVEEIQDWDVLGTAEEKAGRYFVVRSRKGRET